MRSAVLIGILMIVGCNSKSEKTSKNSENEDVHYFEQNCDAQKHIWKTCIVLGGGASQLHKYNFSSGNEVTVSYSVLNDENCTGTEVSQGEATAIYSLGAIGESLNLNSATDITLAPISNTDIGCGNSNEVYRVIQFSNSCKEFRMGEVSCDENNISSVLEDAVYTQL